MKKIHIVIICAFVVVLIGVLYVFNPIVILPTTSSKYKLTLVNLGGPAMKKITLNQYINGRYEKSYTLELKYELRYQVPQKYEMPQIEEGSATVIVECLYDKPFELNYEDANKLCKQGLLIYSASDLSTTIETDGIVSHDRYIHFKSGESKTSFVQKAEMKEWMITENSPELKPIQREWMGYSLPTGEWKEYNQWTETSR